MKIDLNDNRKVNSESDFDENTMEKGIINSIKNLNKGN